MDNNLFKAIADNSPLMAALKARFLEEFAIEHMSIDNPLDNEGLGELVRSRLEGIAKVEKVFKDIAGYQSTPAVGEKINPGY